MANLLNMSGGSLLNKVLPYDAEIEYLKTSGENEQCIVTNFILKRNYILKFSIYEPKQDSYWIIGTLTSWGNRMYEVGHFATASSSYTAGINSNYFSGGRYSSGLHTYKMGMNSVNKDDVVLINIRNTSYFEITTPLSILKVHNANIISGKDIRIYNVQVFNTSNDTLLDLIPVRVGTTGYMYDKVSGQLFGNAGTGSFILGPDV